MDLLKRISVLALIVCGVPTIFVARTLSSPDGRRSRPRVEKAEPIVVSVDAKGRFKFGDKAITLNRLGRVLDAAMDERNPSERIVYLKAGSRVSFSQVVKVLKLGRTVHFDTFGLILAEKDASDIVGAVITKINSESPSQDIKPNPLYLGIAFRKDGKLSLNGESHTTASLTKRLSDIFAERTENGIFDERTNEVVKSVFLVPSVTTTFGAIVQAARVIRDAGAEPVGIEIDGPRLLVVEMTRIGQ